MRLFGIIQVPSIRRMFRFGWFRSFLILVAFLALLAAIWIGFPMVGIEVMAKVWLRALVIGLIVFAVLLRWGLAWRRRRRAARALEQDLMPEPVGDGVILAERTQEAYVRAADGLAAYYRKSPAEVSEAELRQYLLYLKNDKQVATSTWVQVLCGLKFLYQHTLRREWPVLDLVKPEREQKLPVVLSRTEVQRVLGCLRLAH